VAEEGVLNLNPDGVGAFAQLTSTSIGMGLVASFPVLAATSVMTNRFPV